jgi:GDPmannose 4,6-dehydratase
MKNESNIIKFNFDMNEFNILEHTLSIIKPHVIVHLASISSSQYCFNNPLETLYSNGFLTAKICDIIHKKCWNTKLFNASSSEIYKGHVDYKVEEDDFNMYHLHPYSIAKTMGHNIVEFYRKTFGLPFSNGVIFTTESSLKKPVFLLNKIASHIREWKNGNNTHLQVGNLDSYRNILHASDVANAIHNIISQENGDSYLICNDESHKIIDLVIKLYSLTGIELEKKDTCLNEKTSGLEVVSIQDQQIGVDLLPTNIKGMAIKLRNLGWKPLISIESILVELV